MSVRVDEVDLVVARDDAAGLLLAATAAFHGLDVVVASSGSHLRPDRFDDLDLDELKLGTVAAQLVSFLVARFPIPLTRAPGPGLRLRVAPIARAALVPQVRSALAQTGPRLIGRQAWTARLAQACHDFGVRFCLASRVGDDGLVSVPSGQLRARLATLGPPTGAVPLRDLDRLLAAYSQARDLAGVSEPEVTLAESIPLLAALRGGAAGATGALERISSGLRWPLRQRERRGPDEGARVADRVYPPVIVAAKTMFKLLGLKIELAGLEHVPASGGAVLASNHIGYLDFIFAGLAPYEANRRLTRFMAKEVVFENKIAGPLMRGMHHIPVDREAGSASFRAALKALKAGEIVGLFPEATTSRSYTVKEIKSGAIRMAATAGVPLLPVALWGTHKLWAKGRRLTFARGTTIQITVGEPMLIGKRDDFEAATEQLKTTLQAMVSAEQATHPDTADPGPHAWYLPAHLGGSAPTPEQAAELDAADAARRRAEWEAKQG